jgi:phytanoyl-CoA hydroxylase
MQLTPEQLRTYQAEGFLVLEDVFDTEEITMLDERIEIQRRQLSQRLNDRQLDENVSPNNDFISVICPDQRDGGIGAFIRGRNLSKLVMQLLGPDIDLYYSESVLKRPHGKLELPWHQDDAYMAGEPLSCLIVWLALSDANEENGCMSVLPGSHKKGLVKHWEGSVGLECHSLSDPDQGMQLPVRAGSMIMLSSLTIHRSGTNRSETDSKDFVIQYTAPSPQGTKPGFIVESRIPIIRNGNMVGTG